jgi:hypothetical protein
MSVWEQIAWFPICGGLTAVGLVLSYFRWRRSGARAGMRLSAWSLLPLAAYLTGVVLLIGRVGAALVRFGGSFAFSPKSWSGVVLAGISVVLFLVSGGIPLLSRKRAKGKKAVQAAAPSAVGTVADAEPAKIGTGTGRLAKPAKRGAPAAADDDLKDIEEILRRRGIQ